jgi:negative regulator of sigma E activity
MNDELNISDEQLRLATQRSLPAQTTLDDETQACRDAFVTLGSALEAAAGDFDEAQLIARLQDACLNEPTRCAELVLKRPAASGWWPMVLGGVLAASVLVAIVQIAMMSNSHSGNQLGSNPTRPQRPKNEMTQEMLTVVAWSDPLDEEIALAAATLDQLSGRNRGFDGSLFEMNERLEALSQELSVESL